MSQDQSDRIRNHDGVIRGEVVPADERDEPDETASPSPDRYQQTYLHKVATARPAEDEATTSGYPVSGTRAEALADSDPAHATGTGLTSESIAHEDAPAEDEAATRENTTGDEALAADQAAATDPSTTAADANVATDPSTTAADANGATDPSTTAADADGAADAGTTTGDAGDAAAGGGVSTVGQAGKHRAGDATDEVAGETEEPASTVPQARRPGDEPVPPEITGRLLADAAEIRARWMRIQAQFVDDPRAAVTEAATILTDVASQLQVAVRERQQAMRGRWDGNGRADTEALRVMMQQYRALLDRLADL
jgi:hypothetical protein